MSEEKTIQSEEVMESKDAPSVPDSPEKNEIKKTNSFHSDWKSKFFEMDLLSPIYIFLFILLFTNGKDGADLHDAIVNFVMTYNN